MLGALKKYHKYLVRRTEASGPRDRWFEIKGVMMPWFLPLIVPIFVEVVFRPDGMWRFVGVIPFVTVSLAGMIYAGLVFMIYGVRADIRRVKDAKRNGG